MFCMYFMFCGFRNSYRNEVHIYKEPGNNLSIAPVIISYLLFLSSKIEISPLILSLLHFQISLGHKHLLQQKILLEISSLSYQFRKIFSFPIFKILRRKLFCSIMSNLNTHAFSSSTKIYLSNNWFSLAVFSTKFLSFDLYGCRTLVFAEN